jgi:hypothetical protein
MYSVAQAGRGVFFGKKDLLLTRIGQKTGIEILLCPSEQLMRQRVF